MFNITMRGAVAAACATAALVTPADASAEWVRAESTNFIAYSEGTPEDLKTRVADLEKFGMVLQSMTGARRPKQVPVKITVYFMRDIQDVADTLPYPADGVAGYYNTTMRGPFTVMPRLDHQQSSGARIKRPGMEAKTVLQHELTHHFMFQYFTAAYPSWYVEGFADYAGAIEISQDNVVQRGMFLDNRAQALRQMSWVPLKELMNPIPGKSSFDGFAFYSQGWITVHFLNSTPERQKMLTDYLNRINAGEDFGKALAAFGDMDRFDKDVRAYSRLSKLGATEIKYVSLDPGAIEMKALTPAQEALVPIQLSLSAGIRQSAVQAFAKRVRDIARRHPEDPHALRYLADAERIAGNRALSLAAADRLLAISATEPWGNYFRGVSEIDGLAQAKSTDDKAWQAARARIRSAMRALPNEPRFGRALYDSYISRGVLPPATAQNALIATLDLIPRENSLRMLAARDYEARGLIDDAINTLAPLAYGLADETEKQKKRRERMQGQYRTVEEEDDKETAREMLVRLIAKRDGKPAAGAAAASAKP